MKSTTLQMRSLMLALGISIGLGLCPMVRAQNDKPSSDATKPAGRDPVTDAALIANSTAKSKPLRILVIGGHPADVFDQSGGTMAHHIARGDWVGCVVMTTGVRIHDKVVANELAERKDISAAEMNKIMAERANVKKTEVIKACSLLGVHKDDIYFLGADDAVLLVNEPMIRQIAQYIRKLKPDVIITHYPYEDGALGSPHAQTGQMVVHAITLAASVDPDDKNLPHHVTQVFFFGMGAASVRTHLWSAQGGFYNDVFVDITDVAAKKVACLDCMASQGYDGAYARKRIDSLDGAFGNQARVPYAEGFITLYSSVNYYLPVSPIDLEHAKSSDADSITRRSYRVNVP
jgi:LmbE family N-acetylglucosaminyl deacetylase